MDYTVGSVSYTNARPLVHSLAGKVQVELAVPSALPELLDSGEAQAILVSSFDALSTPGRTFAEGCSIGSLGAAGSVRLFSMAPLSEIKSLALDQSSLTSNNLALIVLAEQYGIKPTTETFPPNLGKMLKSNDACVLIGDKGLATDGTGLDVMDLGQEWLNMTGLPFVWALWVGRDDLSEELVSILNDARAWGQAHLDEIIPDAMARSGWDEPTVRKYLGETMNYDLTDRHLEGLQLFRTLLIKHGLMPKIPFPRIVHGTPLTTV